MTSEETIVLTRQEYNALLERNSELEDRLAALDADDGCAGPSRGGPRHYGRQEAHPRLSEPSGRHPPGIVEENRPRSQLPL